MSFIKCLASFWISRFEFIMRCDRLGHGVFSFWLFAGLRLPSYSSRFSLGDFFVLVGDDSSPCRLAVRKEQDSEDQRFRKSQNDEYI